MRKWEVADLAPSDFVLRTSLFKIGAPTWIRTTSLRLRRVACRISCTLGAESCRTWTRTRTGGLTGRRATLTPSGRTPSAAGLRTEVGGWNSPSLGGDFAVGTGGSEGNCTRNRPADNGALWQLSYGSMNWWETLVTLQSSSSGRFCDGGFTGRWPERFPKTGTPPWCCPRHIRIWRPDCAAGARRVRAADRVAYPAVIRWMTHENPAAALRLRRTERRTLRGDSPASPEQSGCRNIFQPERARPCTKWKLKGAGSSRAPDPDMDKQRTNTVAGRYRCGHRCFAVDVSVFGAHLLRSPSSM